MNRNNGTTKRRFSVDRNSRSESVPHNRQKHCCPGIALHRYCVDFTGKRDSGGACSQVNGCLLDTGHCRQSRLALRHAPSALGGRKSRHNEVPQLMYRPLALQSVENYMYIWWSRTWTSWGTGAKASSRRPQLREKSAKHVEFSRHDMSRKICCHRQ